jgi:hypothetical protein
MPQKPPYFLVSSWRDCGEVVVCGMFLVIWCSNLECLIVHEKLSRKETPYVRTTRRIERISCLSVDRSHLLVEVRISGVMEKAPHFKKLCHVERGGIFSLENSFRE